MHTWEEGAVSLMLFTTQLSLATLLRGIPLRLGSMLHTMVQEELLHCGTDQEGHLLVRALCRLD